MDNKIKNSLDRTKDLAQIFSWIAIPVVVALFGWLIQSALKESEIRRDYVQMAVGILTGTSADNELREWAAQVIQENSPTPFGEKTTQSLVGGFPFLYRPPQPPAILMEPPDASILERAEEQAVAWAEKVDRASVESISETDLIDLLRSLNEDAMKAYLAAVGQAQDYATTLRFLQRWANMVTETDVKAIDELPLSAK